MRKHTLGLLFAMGASAAASVQLVHASTVTVKAGETLWSIAHAHHVSVAALIAANPKIDPSHLQIGERLQLPGSAQARIVTTQRYLVQRGDTLWSISAHFHVSINAILQANPGLSANTLRYGTTIRIPSHAAAAVSKSAKTSGAATRPASAARKTSSEVRHTNTKTSTNAAENLTWMARIIHAEAHDQPMRVLIAVGDVVWHRMLSHPGTTVKDVVFARTNGHYQFSTAANGLVWHTPDAASWAAAKAVLEQHKDVVPGAYYFFNVRGATAWLKNQPVVDSFDGMVFAK
ncbi:MAG: LysM peptidoglycan-binding domain-containing protein [Alicyclobacillus sp.]|nr:LysM peptidoglycan-binding domain-containing protein [Alicyclobacillus sp.]